MMNLRVFLGRARYSSPYWGHRQMEKNVMRSGIRPCSADPTIYSEQPLDSPHVSLAHLGLRLSRGKGGPTS